MIDSHIRPRVQPFFDILAHPFVRFSPSAITLFSFALGLFAAICFFANLKIALVFLWLSGLFDVLDGTVARLAGKKSDWGALLDIICDRVVEISFVFAAALMDADSRLACVVLLGSIIFSFSVFLVVGALAENSGKKAFRHQAGLAERTETFIIFSCAILFPQWTREIFYIFAAMIAYTGSQRLWGAKKILKGEI